MCIWKGVLVMSNVLVTAIGSFSADVVIKNLHKMGHRVIGMDIYPAQWVANSLQADVFYQSPYASDTECYVDFVNRICREENVDYVLPLTDVEVDVLIDHLPEKGMLCISPKETIEICRDKYKLYQVLRERGIRCLIPTEEFEPENIERYVFPLVLKPQNGRSSQGLHYVKSERELRFLSEMECLDHYVVQPKKEGRIVTVDILRTDDFFMASPRVELLRTPNGAGTSVQVFSDENIEAAAREIADILGIRGCVNFEFIKSEKELWFLECNPRFSGGVAFSCMAGYDYISNHMKCFCQIPPDAAVPVEEKYIARKYSEYITG